MRAINRPIVRAKGRTLLSADSKLLEYADKAFRRVECMNVSSLRPAIGHQTTVLQSHDRHGVSALRQMMLMYFGVSAGQRNQ